MGKWICGEGKCASACRSSRQVNEVTISLHLIQLNRDRLRGVKDELCSIKVLHTYPIAEIELIADYIAHRRRCSGRRRMVSQHLADSCICYPSRGRFIDCKSSKPYLLACRVCRGRGRKLSLVANPSCSRCNEVDQTAEKSLLRANTLTKTCRLPISMMNFSES